MINFNNHNIKEIHYDNHTIKKVYGCDGKLVWENNPCGNYMLSYNRQYGQGATFTIPYNGRTEIPYDAVDYEKTNDIKIFNLSFGPCVNSIAAQAFQNVISTPEELHIPSNIKSIGECAFDRNTGLTVYMESLTPPSISEHTFICHNCQGQPTFYVPAEALNTYKTANIWSGYASRIFPIS